MFVWSNAIQEWGASWMKVLGTLGVLEDFGPDGGARLSVVSASAFQQRGFLNLRFSEAFYSSLLVGFEPQQHLPCPCSLPPSQHLWRLFVVYFKLVAVVARVACFQSCCVQRKVWGQTSCCGTVCVCGEFAEMLLQTGKVDEQRWAGACLQSRGRTPAPQRMHI